MSTEDLKIVLEDLNHLPIEAVKKPDRPIDITIQEAINLHSWCQYDLTSLLQIGLTREFIDSLLIRSGALQEAESLWLNQRDGKEETHIKWSMASKSGYELRDIILHSFRYAYRQSEDIHRKLKIIGYGNSHADMIQDLNDLAVIGREHSEELIKINFDMPLLEQAKALSASLGKILADAKASEKTNDAKDLRDRAFSYLKEVVDEIRAAGQSIFWRSPERLKGYRSEYNYNRNHSSNNKDISNEE